MYYSFQTLSMTKRIYDDHLVMANFMQQLTII